MEREKIRFEKHEPPISIHNIVMREGGVFRGLHSHNAIEIITVKSGTLSCYINGDMLDVKEKQTVLINSNIGHKLSSNNAEIVYMQIDISSCKANNYQSETTKIYDFILLSQSKPYMIFSDNKEIDGILHKINQKFYDNEENSRWYLKAYIYELIAFMYTQYFIIASVSDVSNIEKIAPIVSYLDANFKLPIELCDVSEAIGYNKYAICHIFKAVTGRTVFDYINFLRIHYAIQKLSQKNNTILEVAIESGFSSATYFNRVFKNVIGCTPKEYRKYLVKYI